MEVGELGVQSWARVTCNVDGYEVRLNGDVGFSAGKGVLARIPHRRREPEASSKHDRTSKEKQDTEKGMQR